MDRGRSAAHFLRASVDGPYRARRWGIRGWCRRVRAVEGERFVPQTNARAHRATRKFRALRTGAALRSAVIETLEERQMLSRPTGIDISEFQPTVNFNTVKNTGGKSFVIMRASYGTSTRDA